MKPTLHVVSLPHTTLTEADITCAYSMKVLKFTKMMRRRGYPVVLYGPDETDAEATEHVTIATVEDRVRWGFPPDGFDTVKTPLLWDAREPYWAETNERAIEAIRERAAPHDILLLIAGWAQQPIAAAVGKDMIVAEWGVGYEGIFARFCAYESYAWQHYLYGKHEIINGRAFDAVIPNFFDVDDFKHPSVWRGAPKADYLLYIGRVILRKGPHVANDIAQRVGLPLVVAGPGVTSHRRGHVEAAEVTIEGGDVQYVGQVGFEERANLMGRAAAVMVPTLYNEPFGGVAVEAMMAGTPVVASDWGSFTEIVTPEVGRRFRTLAQGARATEEAMTLDPLRIREVAEAKYSLDAVGRQFDEWFQSLGTLWGDGWYA